MKPYKQNRKQIGGKTVTRKYPKLSSDKKKEFVIEETLEHRMNKIIEKNKAISELVIGNIPYSFNFISEKFLGTTNKPAKISAFEKAIVGIINIDQQVSFSKIGEILGLDLEHDVAEINMLRKAIDSMISYKLIAGDESAYFITETGKEFAINGERMSSFTSDFELLYLSDFHSFLHMKSCVSSLDNATQIDRAEVIKDSGELVPLSLDEIIKLAEIQCSNVQCSKERFLLQNASLKTTKFFKYAYTICFLQSIRTKEIRTIVYDDNIQSIIPHLSNLIDENSDFKQKLFDMMLKSATENEELSVVENLEQASGSIDKEDLETVLAAEKRLIAQEDQTSLDTSKESEDTDSIDLSERLHKRALYDAITFETEIHNIFQIDKPDEIWLSSPWISDGTFLRNRLPLIKNFLNCGGKVFISYSAPDGGLDSFKTKMVMDKSKLALDKLSSEYPKQFFLVELPPFHKKNVIEVKNGQCILFTGSFNVLSFSVSKSNVTHVRAEEMCLAHYQAAIKQYSEAKRQFASIYINEALNNLNEMSSDLLLKYKNPRLSYFRSCDELADLFIDYDNALEERINAAEQEQLLAKWNSLQKVIEKSISHKLKDNDIKRYRIQLFNLSKEFEQKGIEQSYLDQIHKLHSELGQAKGSNSSKTKGFNLDSEKSREETYSNILRKAVENYDINPKDENELFLKIVSIFYLSLDNNAKDLGVNDKWQNEIVKILMNKSWSGVVNFSISYDMKNNGFKRLFVVLNGYFFTFNAVNIDNKSTSILFKRRQFLDKASNKDAFKALREITDYLK